MTLRKIFLDPTTKFHPDALLRHCERFADEKKIHALEAIADTSKDLRHVHIEEIYNLILDIYRELELYTYMTCNNIKRVLSKTDKKIVNNPNIRSILFRLKQDGDFVFRTRRQLQGRVNIILQNARKRHRTLQEVHREYLFAIQVQ